MKLLADLSLLLTRPPDVSAHVHGERFDCLCSVTMERSSLFEMCHLEHLEPMLPGHAHMYLTHNKFSLISLTVRTVFLRPQANDFFCKCLLCVSVVRLEILCRCSGLSSEPNCLHLHQSQLCLFAKDQRDQHGWPC